MCLPNILLLVSSETYIQKSNMVEAMIDRNSIICTNRLNRLESFRKPWSSVLVGALFWCIICTRLNRLREWEPWSSVLVDAFFWCSISHPTQIANVSMQPNSEPMMFVVAELAVRLERDKLVVQRRILKKERLRDSANRRNWASACLTIVGPMFLWNGPMA
jgi:hypothetical protein